MNSQILARVAEAYERQQQENQREEDRRRREIAQMHPELDRLLTERHQMILRSVRGAFSGGVPADPERTMAEYNYTFSRRSPVITGYTASDRYISGRMPAYDVEYIVYYTPNGDILIDDYGTPLGIGNLGLNTGECVE